MIGLSELRQTTRTSILVIAFASSMAGGCGGSSSSDDAAVSSTTAAPTTAAPTTAAPTTAAPTTAAPTTQPAELEFWEQCDLAAEFAESETDFKNARCAIESGVPPSTRNERFDLVANAAADSFASGLFEKHHLADFIIGIGGTIDGISFFDDGDTTG